MKNKALNSFLFKVLFQLIKWAVMRSTNGELLWTGSSEERPIVVLSLVQGDVTRFK